MRPQRPEVIANQIRLHRARHKGAFSVVEGRDDKLFLGKFFNPTTNKFIIAENKVNVYGVISILEEARFPGVVGIVDVDFDRLEDRIEHNPNIVVSEYHDLECFQIRSRSFEAVLAQMGSERKIDQLALPVREILVSTAKPIGCLRLYSMRSGLNLRFAELRYSQFIDRRTLTLDQDALISHVKGRSERHDISNEVLACGIRGIQELDYDPWQLCNGDDLLGVLSIGLRSVFGNKKANDVKPTRLREALRLGFERNEFVESEMARGFRRWEGESEGFRLIS